MILGDDVVTGTQCEVVGVAENHLRAGVAQLLRRQTFNGRLRADRHEDRRLHNTVRRGQSAEAGVSVGCQQVELKGHDSDEEGERVKRVKGGTRYCSPFHSFNPLTLSLPSLAQSPRSDSPYCWSFSRTSFKDVMPKFF